MAVLTCIEGNNSDLVEQVVELYNAKPSWAKRTGDIVWQSLVADVTYGKGNFWNWPWHPWLILLASDIEPSMPNVRKEDFTHLSYPDNYVDMLFLDPPYSHHAPHYNDNLYKNILRYEQSNKEYTVNNLYRDGMIEASRVVKHNGLICVKCMDQISGGINRFDHITIYMYAMMMNMIAEDLFILKNPNHPMMRHDHQFHARKNHSYMWVFRNKKTNDNPRVTQEWIDKGNTVSNKLREDIINQFR